jgi:hypothetical protein
VARPPTVKAAIGAAAREFEIVDAMRDRIVARQNE